MTVRSLVAGITLLALGLPAALHVSTPAAAADCLYMKRAVSALTYRYRREKSEYDQLGIVLKRADQEIDTVRQAQTKYFFEHQTTSRELDLRLRYLMFAVKMRQKERAQLHGQALDTYQQLQQKKAELAHCRPGTVLKTPAPEPAEDWAGTYTDTSDHKLEITGSGATFTANTSWTPSATQGGSSTLSCTASGSTAKCHGTGNYFDEDKSIEVTLETTLRKSGSTIRETDRILTAACSPKKVADCKDLGYTPAVHAGAEFTVNVRRE